MPIKVKQVPSTYYGHFYEHIEYGGIYQLVFKRTKQPKITYPKYNDDNLPF